MRRYLYNIELQKTKEDLEISLFKKPFKYPLFSIIYKKVNVCEKYSILKNIDAKGNGDKYELISCFYCRKTNNISRSSIKRMSKNKRRVIRIIKNSKRLRNEFKTSINEVMKSLYGLKCKKIGNLKIYSTNDDILSEFAKKYNKLHKLY